MRLKQCGEGHVVCDTCFTRDQERASNQCMTCRGPITGRATALETLLGLNTVSRQPVSFREEGGLY